MTPLTSFYNGELDRPQLTEKKLLSMYFLPHGKWGGNNNSKLSEQKKFILTSSQVLVQNLFRGTLKTNLIETNESKANLNPLY